MGGRDDTQVSICPSRALRGRMPPNADLTPSESCAIIRTRRLSIGIRPRSHGVKMTMRGILLALPLAIAVIFALMIFFAPSPVIFGQTPPDSAAEPDDTGPGGGGGTPSESVAIRNLANSIEEGRSDRFTVRASGLSSTRAYRVALTASNDGARVSCPVVRRPAELCANTAAARLTTGLPHSTPAMRGASR